MQRYKTLFTSIICCLTVFRLLASEVIIDDKVRSIDLTQYVQLLPIEEENNFKQVMSLPFLSYEQWKDDLEKGTDYWGKISLQKDQSNNDLTDYILAFPLILTDVEIYIVNDEEKYGRTGQFVPYHLRSFTPIYKANLYEFRLLEKPIEIFFKAKCERHNARPEFDIKLYASPYFFSNLSEKKLRQGLFVGFMSMMLIYNLFLYFFNAQDKTYLYYSIYILGIILYSSYNSGLLADLTHSFFIADFPKYAYLGKTSTYLIIFGYLYFLKAFLALEEMLPSWFKIVNLMLIFNLLAFVSDVSLMLSTNFNLNVADVVTVGNAMVYLAMIFLMCFALAKTGDRKSYFIIFGIALMGIGAIFTIVARIKGVDYSTVPFQIGTILEIIIFSLGLAYRRRQIESEKQEALFDLERTQLINEQQRQESERQKEIAEFKSRFYTNITHEFRTPLTIIEGNLDLIEGHDGEKETIRKSNHQMLRLVNQVLELSKLDEDKLQIDYQNGDIISFVKKISVPFQSLCQAKGLKLSISNEEESLIMDFDKEKIEHIIHNLLSNAIKFTDNGGQVEIKTKRVIQGEGTYFALEISDTGRGIAPEMKPLVVKRFYSSAHPEEMSSGIGLSYVKELVELCEGELRIYSKVNEGSTFTVLLPIRNDFPTSPLSSSALAASKSNETSMKEESTSPSANRAIVLVIEDNVDIANYVFKILEKDYDCYHASNGRIGVEMALELVPDIILCDIMMPEMDGYEVMEKLSLNKATNHIPIIILTAKDDSITKLESLSLGADAFLTKPFNKQVLLLKIANAYKRQQSVIEKVRRDFDIENEEGHTDNTIDIQSEILTTIENHIILHLSDSEFNIDNLTEHLSLSKNQLYRKVKAITGVTITQFIRNVRLKEAVKLFENEELNISEVAYHVGFKDPNYFTRVFTKKYGTSPREYLIKNKPEPLSDA